MKLGITNHHYISVFVLSYMLDNPTFGEYYDVIYIDYDTQYDTIKGEVTIGAIPKNDTFTKLI